MTTTACEPTYVEGIDAADKLGISEDTLGRLLATNAAALLRAHADRIEKQRDNRMTNIPIGDFDEHVENARTYLVAAIACFDGQRRAF